MLIKMCSQADHSPPIQRVGRESHFSDQGCARWCARRAHTGREGPHRLCGPNEGRRLAHPGSLCGLQGQSSPFLPTAHQFISRYTFVVPLCLQEIAQLEADAFVWRQQVALATGVKAALDRWVRFEQQEEENELARLVKTIVDSVLKSISEEKTQKDVLVCAVSEVEREHPFPFSLCIRFYWF